MTINPQNVHLVIYHIETGTYDVCTLDHWIRDDKQLHSSQRKNVKTEYLILSAHDSYDSAELEKENYGIQ